MIDACTRTPATPLAAQLASTLPAQDTARLTLRAPRLSDWSALSVIWTDPSANHIGGPFTAEDAWLDFNQCVAGWMLRGFGPLTITDRETGDVLGLLVMGHEWGDPQPELGWLVIPSARGRGIGRAAAVAGLQMMRDWLGPDGFASYIADDNAPSLRIAAGLGGQRTGGHPADASVGVYVYTAGAA